jgi:hypothetical protein
MLVSEFESLRCLVDIRPEVRVNHIHRVAIIRPFVAGVEREIEPVAGRCLVDQPEVEEIRKVISKRPLTHIGSIS